MTVEADALFFIVLSLIIAQWNLAEKFSRDETSLSFVALLHR
jgi:hypothetical protein